MTVPVTAGPRGPGLRGDAVPPEAAAGIQGTSPPPGTPRLLEALETVRDPELDEPVTDLGFVASVSVDGGVAEVHLRLPTYFCAPNFAFLMVADAYDAVGAVPGVERVVVELDYHFASAEINGGVAARAGFVSARAESG